jgi:PAS domain S-box-containing protein
MERHIEFSGYSLSHSDLVRFVVITSLTISCIIITWFSLSVQGEAIFTQIFYFPLLYAAYFYPKKGLYLACICAIVFESLAYLYMVPSISGVIYTTGQALLFIGITALVAYFAEKVNTSEARFRSIFENSLLGMVLFDQNSFAIRLTNSHFETMLGYTEEDLSHMTFAQLFFSKEDQQRFFEYLGSSRKITHFETCFVTKNNKITWVNLSWSRITANLVSCSIMDMNKYKIAEQEADENYAQFRQLTDGSPTSILIIRNQRIVYVNPSFVAFSGYEPDELLDKETTPIIHPDDQNDFLNLCHLAESRSPLPDRSEFKILTKSGNTRLAKLFFTRILQKGIPSVLINLIDITEQDILKERIAEDNERRHSIISSVAHDLRTPLQPIMGYIEMLTQDPESFGITEETRLILDRCARSVDRERQIINQMLELSLLDSGKIPLNYSVFSVPDMLKKIIGTGRYGENAEIAIDVPPDLTFEGDETKVSIVINTMLSNAVKYSTPPRKIRIGYQTSPYDKLHRLSIQDNGVGITDSQLDEIFEPFQLFANGNANRKYDRIGLSLTIAKKYIKMHKGYISVDSIVNIGSTFSIHLPKHKSAASAEVEFNDT